MYTDNLKSKTHYSNNCSYTIVFVDLKQLHYDTFYFLTNEVAFYKFHKNLTFELF